jgi:putative sigma-54 modulation protein
MRKHKTRLLKRTRPRNVSIRHITEQVFHAGTLDEATGEAPPIDTEAPHLPDLEPDRIHPESYQVHALYREEAMMQLEMNEAPFVIFHNAESGRLSILYRRNDGDFGLIEPEA